MSIYEKNLQTIQKQDMELYQAVIAYGNPSSNILKDDVIADTVSAKNGSLITRIEKDGQTVYLNSQYNPEREAAKYIEQYRLVLDYSVMYFVGFGNGMIARELLVNMKEHVQFAFYEPSPNLFLNTIQNYDISDLIENKRIRITVKDLNDKEYVARWGSLVTEENYQICLFDALPKYRQLFKTACEQTEEVYRYFINMNRINVVTEAHFGKREATNDIQNMKYLVNCNCEEDFQSCFPTDKIVILVGAGPSLEKNIHVLKKAKNRAFIIAVDTVLGYLLDCEVYPDLVVSCDPGKSLKHFNREKAETIPLAMNSALNTKVVEKMSVGKLIFITSENPYYDGLFQLADRHMYSLSGGGSVSTIAFALALAWGFRRLVLVGQDLALSADKVHVGNVGYDHGRLEGEQIPVEGYYGETVYTSQDYKQYLDWYNIVIENNPDMEVINATEGGARIRGAKNMSLQEVLDTFCIEEFDFEKVIREKEPTFSGEKWNLCINKWKESVHNLTELGYKLVKGIRLAETAQKTVRKGNYSAKEVQRMQSEIDEILEECDKAEEIYFIACMIAQEQEDVLGDIYLADEDSDAEYCRILEKLANYMKSMEKAVEEIKDMFLQMIESVLKEA